MFGTLALPSSRNHQYADVDEPRINFLAREPLSSLNDQLLRPIATCVNPASHVPNSNSSTDDATMRSCGSLAPSAFRSIRKQLQLHSSCCWDDVAETELFGAEQEHVNKAPKVYVPLRDLLEDSRKMGASQHAATLCSSWIAFSSGSLLESIFVVDSSLSVAVQFFSDRSCAPRLRSVTATKPWNYSICSTGALVESQSSTLPPLWSGDDRFYESNQRVVFASWVFWREIAGCSIPHQNFTPTHCTACSAATGKTFRFHFLSNGELVVLGSSSGFVCRGASIIADRSAAVLALQKFKSSIESSTDPAAAVCDNMPSPSSRAATSIHSLCQAVASFQNLHSKNAWKVGENLYDRLILSSWAPTLNKLITRASLNTAALDSATNVPAHRKRARASSASLSAAGSSDQTWEEYLESESQRERDDRMLAQKLQDEELASARLSALRSRRGLTGTLSAADETQAESLMRRERPIPPQRSQRVPSAAPPLDDAPPIASNDFQARATGATVSDRSSDLSCTRSSPRTPTAPPSFLSSEKQSDFTVDSDGCRCSTRSSAADVNRIAGAGPKIRFVHKHDQNSQVSNVVDSAIANGPIALQSLSLLEVRGFLHMQCLFCFSHSQMSNFKLLCLNSTQI
jgi:hypothetical protein